MWIVTGKIVKYYTKYYQQYKNEAGSRIIATYKVSLHENATLWLSDESKHGVRG